MELLNIFIIVLFILVISISFDKFTYLNKDVDTGLIEAKPTPEDPFMNNIHPTLKVLPPIYTPEEHHTIEKLLHRGDETDPEGYYDAAFSRHLDTEIPDDFEAFKDFMGYTRKQPDFYPDKMNYINAFNN